MRVMYVVSTTMMFSSYVISSLFFTLWLLVRHCVRLGDSHAEDDDRADMDAEE